VQDEFKQYIISLYKDIPQEVYEGLLSVFCLGVVLFVAFKGVRTGFRWSSFLLLIEYIFLLFCSTVIFRPTGETRQYDFHPFWSYDRPELLVENIMNIIVFIPIVLLLGIVFKQMTWWKVLLIGCSISVTIEALQFWFMKGFSEVDDVMHNTEGCLIGWFMMKSSRLMVQGCQNLLKM
jgi:glucan phosphoethanolaminetransferase (alkaline phosphatase superfamily)